MITTRTTSNLGSKRFISAYRSKVIIEGTQGRNLGRGTEARPLAFSSWLAQSKPPRTTFLGVALSTVGWALPHLSLIKKMLRRLAYRQCYGSISSSGVLSPLLLSPSKILSCVKLKKQSNKQNTQPGHTTIQVFSKSHNGLFF